MLVGNQDDFDDALGYPTAKPPAGAPYAEVISSFKTMLQAVSKDYPNVKYMATQMRVATNADCISWSAVLYEVSSGKMYQSIVREDVPIADRVGGGDSFTSGLAAGFLQGKGVQHALEMGAAHGILVQEFPGDTTYVKQSEVEAEIKRASSGGGVSALR